MTSTQTIIQDTQRWLERAVIGLNLCPFAKAVHVKGLIHYAVSDATTAAELLIDLKKELNSLVSGESIAFDTTLLIAPFCLEDFLEFNALLNKADKLLAKMGLEGVIQIASLHPHYQFAGTEIDDITNFTNRAPYPTLHLLREASIDQAVAAFPEAETIFEANMQTMQRLGRQGWADLDVERSVQVPAEDAEDSNRGKMAP